MTLTGTAARLSIWHVVKGAASRGADVPFRSGGVEFGTPALDLDQLVWPRIEPGPAFNVPSAEIIDLLVATGEAVRADTGGYLAEALESLTAASDQPGELLGRVYDNLWQIFDRRRIEFHLDNELGGAAVVDGWRPVHGHDGRECAVRAFPPRLVHILAGNAAGLGPSSIVRAALTKGVHLFKLPSNDLFTTTAVLRIMADVAPGHPVVRSMSAVYWRGGDEIIEGTLFRPQFFDKIVAWGGEATIRGALRYVGPGFELVSFDPKNSISVIGREAFADSATLASVAAAAATDASLYNQEACVSSRFQFVEGDVDQVDEFCAALVGELGVDRATSSAIGPKVPEDLRAEIEVLRQLTPLYRVWGSYDGTGLVIRSPEPLDAYPSGKVVNVVPLSSIHEAAKFANVSTQTVGVFPPHRKAEVRDALMSAGVQRVVPLGRAGDSVPGLPHDGFLPLHRFVRWVNDEG